MCTINKVCRVISVSNQKGGVGKTVTCVNLGIGLAREGKKVLLIDADPQGSLAISLGCQEPDKLEYTLATAMMKIINDEPFNVQDGIIRHEEGVDLLPGNIELSGLEVSLIGVISRETILREYIDKAKEQYDYIIIDCMPSLGMLTINALACADSGTDSSTSSISASKGTSTAYKDHWKSKEAAESKVAV